MAGTWRDSHGVVARVGSSTARKGWSNCACRKDKVGSGRIIYSLIKYFKEGNPYIIMRLVDLGTAFSLDELAIRPPPRRCLCLPIPRPSAISTCT